MQHAKKHGIQPYERQSSERAGCALPRQVTQKAILLPPDMQPEADQHEQHEGLRNIERI
jgi:hypothetical protein